MNRFPLFLAVMFAGVLALAWTEGRVAAHEGATGVVKARMAAMKSLKAVLWRGKPLAAAVEDADAIARHAGAIPELFPKGSDKEPSEAKPAVWTDRARFEALAEELASRAAAFAQSLGTASRAATKAAFRDVGAICSRCHEGFRERK